MKAQLPNEVIDRILLYCDVSIAIRLRREYVKKQLLQNRTLAERWMSTNDRDLISWLMHYNVQGYNSRTIILAARDGYLEVIKWLHDNISSKALWIPIISIHQGFSVGPFCDPWVVKNFTTPLFRLQIGSLIHLKSPLHLGCGVAEMFPLGPPPIGGKPPPPPFGRAFQSAQFTNISWC